MQFANSSWKEWGVLGSESIRTRTAIAGDYRVGINTIARADHDAYANAFACVRYKFIGIKISQCF